MENVVDLCAGDNAPNRAPRELEDIFADLRALAQSPGAIHNLSAIIYRNSTLAFDMSDGKVVDEPEKRWSLRKLNRNELMLLFGLAVQSTSTRTYSLLPNDTAFAEQADRLLHEFHLAMSLSDLADADLSDFMIRASREAIYYGAESFYMHQLKLFSRHRYKEDGDWLLRNAGLSIRPMLDIAEVIVQQINNQMTIVAPVLKDKRLEILPGLTNSLLISKRALIRDFGDKANCFLAKFTTPAVQANSSFVHPFAVNQVSVRPLLDIGDCIYVIDQYRLVESIYESPSYWMMEDTSYREIANKNRGSFLERTTAKILKRVFGDEHVHENVVIYRNKKQVAAEADVIVNYGEFIIIVQAKSKRLTLKARAGDHDALKEDFAKAIQEPYNQAGKFANLVLAGAECFTRSGGALTFSETPRVFPMVALSDCFPASMMLSVVMLDYVEELCPVIWDLGVLDCVAKVLPTPVEFISYLKCRARAFQKVSAANEYSLLGYHLVNRLMLPSDADHLSVDQDYSTEIDDYMIAIDLNVKRRNPVSVLERLDIPIISELFVNLKDAPPQLASVVVDLLEFSVGALEEVSRQISSLRQEVSSGKRYKAASTTTKMGDSPT